MAILKLLRDENTGNVYECLLNDKGEIVQEHFIPSSEVSRHPKFTAPLEEKNKHNYYVPDYLIQNMVLEKPSKNSLIMNTSYDNSEYETRQYKIEQLLKMFNTHKSDSQYRELINETNVYDKPKKEFNYKILAYFPIASLIVYLLYLAIENM